MAAGTLVTTINATMKRQINLHLALIPNTSSRNKQIDIRVNMVETANKN